MSKQEGAHNGATDWFAYLRIGNEHFITARKSISYMI